MDPAAVAAVLAAGVDPAPLRLPVGEDQVLALNAQEPPRTHSLQTLNQGLEACGETIPLASELLDPTPLPADRARLLDLLDARHQELRRRVG